MKIYIWQLKPSMHQVALVKALKEISDVTWVMQEMELTSERKRMGWQDGGLKPDINLKTFPEMKEFLSSLDSDSIHLFGGFNASKNLKKALKYCLKQKFNVYVQSESYCYEGIKGKLRTKKLQLDYKLFYKNKIKGVLAMGDLGVNFFTTKMGFPEDKIFPFAYFTEKSKIECNTTIDSAFKIIFVGQLIERKGIDLLIKSCANLKGNWKLDIIGSGSLMEEMKNLASDINKQRINFLDTKTNTEVQKLMAQADLLILPSRWDGWGAVVNEALMNGTQVIATNKCGSSALLKENWRGEVIESSSVNELQTAISERIKKGKLSFNERKRIADWASCLNGNNGANFVKNVLEGNGVINLWI